MVPSAKGLGARDQARESKATSRSREKWEGIKSSKIGTFIIETHFLFLCPRLRMLL